MKKETIRAQTDAFFMQNKTFFSQIAGIFRKRRAIRTQKGNICQENDNLFSHIGMLFTKEVAILLPPKVFFNDRKFLSQTFGTGVVTIEKIRDLIVAYRFPYRQRKHDL